MLRNFLCVFLVVVLLASCKTKSEYPGYSVASNGLNYKLLVIGEENSTIQLGDYVTVEINYKTMGDSVFFHGSRKFQVTKPEYPGSIDDCLLMLGKGDKADFILSVNDFFQKTLSSPVPDYLSGQDKMKIDILVVEVQTEREYLKEKEAFLSWIRGVDDYEKTILNQFINQENIGVTPTSSGMYFVSLKNGNGKKIKQGDTLCIDYEGKFLNGKFFDSTKKRKEPFQFVFGSEWQVIEGMNEALSMMEEGQKALIIMPSKVAFGSTGSATGIIPPYTSLIYEIEILKVN
jgi:FKBP-type peptidyl-prolyl cis-trans isomerase